MRFFVAFAIMSMTLALSSSAPSTYAGLVLTVNTTDNSENGSCGPSVCTFRDASHFATNGYRVEFDIPDTDPGYNAATGVWTIAWDGEYGFNAGVTVDATTQTANRGDTNPLGPELQLDGAQLQNAGTCIRLRSNTTFRGMVLSECGVYGIWAEGSSIVIAGNYIGTGPDGVESRPIDFSGLLVIRAQQVTVGGPNPQDANIIGGSGVGIRVSDESTHEIVITGNETAHNNGSGIRIDNSASGVAISRNSIHSNGSKGIDIEIGSNAGIKAPAITGIGSVSGTACPNCTVEVFSDDGDEGRIYEGMTVASPSGSWTLEVDPSGPNVTATATDAGGNTSEFSEPVPFGQPLSHGDVDCDGNVNSVDALKILRHVASLQVSQNPGCPEIGSEYAAKFGDVDCDDDVDAVDALLDLRYVAQLPVNLPANCGPIGT